MVQWWRRERYDTLLSLTCPSAEICVGAWTALLQRVGANANLARVGLAHGLNTCINVDQSNVAEPSENMVATTVEALIGGAFLDGGLDAATTVMRSLGLL